MATIITSRQKGFDIEAEVEIQNETKYITGTMTVNTAAAVPNGSFTLKVKSSLITDVPRDRKALERAFLDAFREAAFGENGLFVQCTGAHDLKAGKNPNQLTLVGSADKLKQAAKGQPNIEDAIVEGESAKDDPFPDSLGNNGDADKAPVKKTRRRPKKATAESK